MRKVTETLEGYAFAVALTSPPPGDATEPDPAATVCEIHFVDDPDPALRAHTVVARFTSEGKQLLLKQLTGGLIVP